MIKILADDITKIKADVVVNSANPSLAGIGTDLTSLHGGVDGAIHRAAGIELFHACQSLPVVSMMKSSDGLPSFEVRCPEGACKVTAAFNMHSSHIIHAVAPINIKPFNLGRDLNYHLELLDLMYTNIFQAFNSLAKQSIVLPPMGTRSFGMPQQESAQIAMKHAVSFQQKEQSKDIFFSVINPDELKIYQKLQAV